MPNVYQPGLIQVRPQYKSAEPNELSTPENVLWWVGSNLAAFPLTAIQLAVIASAFDTAWANLWKQAGSTNHSYVGSIVTDWSSATGLQLNNVGSFVPVLGNASGQLPASSAMLTSLICGGMPKYRGGHPRVYLPQLAGAALADAYTFVGSIVTAVSGQWPNVDSAMAGVGSGNGGGYQQVVYRNRNTLAKAAIYTVTHRTVQTRVATQRRRLRKAPHH